MEDFVMFCLTVGMFWILLRAHFGPRFGGGASLNIFDVLDDLGYVSGAFYDDNDCWDIDDDHCGCDDWDD